MNPRIFCDLSMTRILDCYILPASALAPSPTSASSGSLKNFWGNPVACFEALRALFTFTAALIFIIYSFDMCFL